VRDLPTAQRYIGPSQDGGASSVALVLARVNVPEARLDADARLVAAAPELLAACQSALVDWAAFKQDFLAVTESASVLLIRAAVAKATGEQP
jgi:hypothetical protein